jgi:hypothetical protein
MITGTPLFGELSEDDQKFLKRYIGYIQDRLDKPIIPQYTAWVARNARSLYPHISGLFGLIPRILYGIIGAPIITKFFGKK